MTFAQKNVDGKNNEIPAVQDEVSRKSMDRESKTEKSRNRIEKRTTYITDDIEWPPNKDE